MIRLAPGMNGGLLRSHVSLDGLRAFRLEVRSHKRPSPRLGDLAVCHPVDPQGAVGHRAPVRARPVVKMDGHELSLGDEEVDWIFRGGVLFGVLQQVAHKFVTVDGCPLQGVVRDEVWSE